MPISYDQCRAGRSLLNWSQGELAANANVSRGTIADFESGSRWPMKNNLRSIEDSMFAAGVEFISAEGSKGEGVRFRERRLQFSKSIKINRFENTASIPMEYGGERFQCVVDLDTLDDFHSTDFSTDDQYAKALGDVLHSVLAAAERRASTHIKDGRFLVTYEMLRDG
ncbi:helix-turn-helix domain-containing protein [Gymnodinialimonas ulvae]|uniref:helix-turn-helix domain-containing protein n=1 Tax=Gymnodinialimonas ulvae TaxID=3126504 RepID=UPI00309774DB